VLAFKLEHGVFSHVLIALCFAFREGIEITKHLYKRGPSFPRHVAARGARSEKYHQSPFHNQKSFLALGRIRDLRLVGVADIRDNVRPVKAV